MHGQLSVFEKSMLRSKHRSRTLLNLSSFSEASVGQLAAAGRTSHKVIRGVLVGWLPKYRIELSLVVMGLAEELVTSEGKVYRITERGRRKARQLAARHTRRAERKRAEQERRDRARSIPIMSGAPAPAPGPATPDPVHRHVALDAVGESWLWWIERSR